MPSLLDVDLDDPGSSLGLLGIGGAPGAGLLDAGDAPRITPPDDRTVSAADAYDALRSPSAPDTSALLARIMGNPIGAERLGEQSLTNQSGPFDPIVDNPQLPGGGLIRRSQYDAMEEGSKSLFGNLAMIAGGEGGEGPGVPGGRTTMLPARRVGRPGPPTRGAMPPDVPEVSPGPPAAPPAGPAATVADIGGGTRGMMAVPSLRSMTPAEASVQAATDAHIIPKPGGGFVGAPESVQTPADLVQMRAELDAKVAAGAEGRNWYGQARDWISDVTGTPRFDPTTGGTTGFGTTGYGSNSGDTSLLGNPTEARRTAEGLAVFSPQANPDTNLQFYLQARNAYMRGEPLPLVRNTQQAAKFNEGMAAKDVAAEAGDPEPDIRQGPKTGPYAWHLSPDRPYGTTGVNDIWHARSFGYTNPDGSEFDGSPTTQQHMFMDYETVKAIDRANENATGGYTDWNAASVQAAPWVANKEATLARQRPGWTPEEVHAEALKTYPDFAKGVTAYMPNEQVPGKSTGLYDALPEDQRGAFSGAATWRDPQTGRDMLTGSMLLQGPMGEGTGTFRNSAGSMEYNPVATAQPLVDFTAGSKPREIAPGTQSALTGSSYARGYVDMQEGSPWHHIDTREGQPLGLSSSMRLLGPRPTQAQMAALQDVADKHGYWASDTGDGVSMINAGEPGKSPANGIEQRDRLSGGMAGEIDAALPGAAIVPGRAQGDYAGLADQLASGAAGQGQATNKLLAELEDMRTKAPGMYERLMNNPGVADKAQQNLTRLEQFGMEGVRPDYVKALQIISGGNLKALLEHVTKAGSAVGLPAALAAYGASSGGQGQSQ